MWRSHHEKMSYSEEQNRHLGDDVSEAGGEVLLDQRVRRAGSHHQKLVVLRHPDDPGARRGVRRRHRPVPLPPRRRRPRAATRRRCRWRRSTASAPPWHDVQLELRGPVVGLLDDVFRERWTDPRSLDTDNPISYLKDRLRHVDLDPRPAARAAARTREPAGPCHVQVLRTYPAIRPSTPYAPHGERSVARGYAKAFRRARRLIYLEDQYMWSPHIARLLADALHAEPRAAPRRGRAAPPRRRRPLRAAAQPGGPARGDPGRAQGRARPGARVRPGEPRRHAGLRAREGRASSTTCGRARAARTSTGARGATTASCRARCSTRPATSGSPPTPPASATAPAGSPATCG